MRAGLELIGAVSALKPNAPLQTRVGVATGLVVVGDLIGSGEAQERGIVGEVPNLAARLQGIAERNTVVIAEGTRKLLGNLFEPGSPDTTCLISTALQFFFLLVGTLDFAVPNRDAQIIRRVHSWLHVSRISAASNDYSQCQLCGFYRARHGSIGSVTNGAGIARIRERIDR